MTALVIILGLALWGGAYLISCALHPYIACGRCKGNKQLYSTSFEGAYGDCWRCKGTGRKRRAGAKLIGRGED